MRAAHDVPVVSVLAVDDHAAFLEAVCAVVRAASGFEVVAEALSGEDALVVADRCGPDLILVDVHLPGIDGCELTRRLKVLDPAAVVFLLSSDDDPALQDASAACGAAVFMPKTRFGRHALASAWAHFGPHPAPDVSVPATPQVRHRDR
jgi:DNA-binding NarL/FixJ family response regulator